MRPVGWLTPALLHRLTRWLTDWLTDWQRYYQSPSLSLSIWWAFIIKLVSECSVIFVTSRVSGFLRLHSKVRNRMGSFTNLCWRTLSYKQCTDNIFEYLTLSTSAIVVNICFIGPQCKQYCLNELVLGKLRWWLYKGYYNMGSGTLRTTAVCNHSMFANDCIPFLSMFEPCPLINGE